MERVQTRLAAGAKHTDTDVLGGQVAMAHTAAQPLLREEAYTACAAEEHTLTNQEDIAGLKARLEDALEESESRWETIQVLTQKVKMLTTTTLPRRNTANVAAEHVEALDARNYELEMMNETLREELDTTKAKLARLLTTQREHDDSVQEQTAEMDQMRGAYIDSERRLAEVGEVHAEEVSRLQGTVRRLESEKIELVTAKERAIGDLDKVKAEADTYLEQVGLVEEDLARALEENETLNVQVKEWEARYSRDTEGLRTLADQTCSKVSKLEQELDTLRDEYSGFKESSQRGYESNIKALEDKLSEITLKTQLARDTEVNDLRREIETMKLDTRHKAELEERDARIVQLERDLKTSHESSGTQAETLSAMQVSNDEMKEQIRNLEYEIGLLLSKKNDVIAKENEETTKDDEGVVNKDQPAEETSKESSVYDYRKNSHEIPERRESLPGSPNNEVDESRSKEASSSVVSTSGVNGVNSSGTVNPDLLGNGLSPFHRYKIEVSGGKMTSAASIKTAKYLMEQLMHHEELKTSGTIKIRVEKGGSKNKVLGMGKDVSLVGGAGKKVRINDHALSKFLNSKKSASLDSEPTNELTPESEVSQVTGLNIEDEKDIEALITTMSGGWFQKFNRHGKNPQPRYVWINPYTRTINWSSRPPNQSSNSLSLKSGSTSTANGIVSSGSSNSISGGAGPGGASMGGAMTLQQDFGSSGADVKSVPISSLEWDEPDINARRYNPQLEHLLKVGMPESGKNSGRKNVCIVPTSWRDHDAWVRGVALLLAKASSSTPRYTATPL